MMKTETENNGGENREKDRDRRGRSARGSRFSDAEGNSGSSNRDRSRERRNCRVYISNIPYDYRWQDLKDLFRRVVGSVEYVELFHDESGKARGCGIVEFKDPDNVQVAMEKMNRYEVNGRELVVKEDHGEQRDQFGRIIRGGGGSGGGDRGGGNNMNDDRSFLRRDDDRLSGRNNYNMMSNDFNNSSNYNYYGLSPSFLESLGITGPLHNKVFVANLDYKVDSKKLKQVFKLAGKVQSVDLSVDKEGNSRGFAVVEYDHPVEAVQAISMFDRQMLFDRRMTVRLDRIPDKGESLKLPEGLGGVGLGLGPNGEPLKDVARNLPNMASQNQQNQSSSSNNMMGGGNMGSNVVGNMFNSNQGQSSSVAPVVQANKNLGNASVPGGLNLSNLNTNNLAAVVGNLGAALNNPLLTSSLSSLGLNLTAQNSGMGVTDDTMASSNASLSNNYSTGGNNYSSAFGNSSGFNLPVPNNGGQGNFGNFNTNSNTGQSSGGGVNNDDFNKMDIFGSGGGNVGGGGGLGGNSGQGVGSGRKSDTIIIKNVPLSCTWQTLRDKFRDVGEVKFAEIRGNDVGVVRFFKERDAELAISLMDGSRIDGRTIKVGYF